MPKFSFALIVLTLAANLIQAAPPTVDSILERYVKEIGGREAVEKTRTLVHEGKADIGGAIGETKSLRKAPNKITWSVELNGATLGQGYDGKTGWKRDPSGISPLEERELRSLLRGSRTPEETRLKETYPNLKYAGTETVAGEPAHILESITSPGISDRLAFSVQSGLLVGRTSKDGEAKSVASFSNYKRVEGVLRSHTTTEKIESPLFTIEYTIKLDKIVVNRELADDLFAKPRP